MNSVDIVLTDGKEVQLFDVVSIQQRGKTLVVITHYNTYVFRKKFVMYYRKGGDL